MSTDDTAAAAEFVEVARALKVPRPQLHDPAVTRARIDRIVAGAEARIAAEQARREHLGSRKLSRREKRAARRSP